MLSIWFDAVLPGLIGSSVLYAFYRLLESRWPASYYSVDDLVGQAVSQSLARYVAFRFGPVYACGVIVAQAAGRPVAAATTFGALHLLLTVLPGFISAVRKGAARRQAITLHALVAGGSATAVAGSVVTAPIWDRLLPDPGKYIEGLLTSTFTVIIFFSLSLLVARTTPTTDGADLLKRLNPSVLSAVVQSAAIHTVDRDFALTLAVVEDLQRPSWIRPAERLLGALHVARTFGPMQGSRTRTLSAEAAIDESLRRISPTVLARPGSYIPSVVLQFHLERHNRSSTFIEMGEEVYRALSGAIVANSDSAGADGSPAVRIITKRRVEDRWILLLDASAEFVRLAGQTLDPSSNSWRSVTATPKRGAYRPLWEITCSIYDERLIVDGWLVNQSEAVRLETYF